MDLSCIWYFWRTCYEKLKENLISNNVTILENKSIFIKEKEEEINSLLEYMKNTKLKITEEIKKSFECNNYQVPTASLSLEQLVKRPELSMEFLSSLIEIPFNEDIKEQVSINLKYEGYIAKSYKEAEKMLKLEKKQITKDIDYDKVKNIASEARQKLKEVRPTTIAQAIRISGVNPADISILSVYLKKEYGKNE